MIQYPAENKLMCRLSLLREVVNMTDYKVRIIQTIKTNPPTPAKVILPK